ncbi:hypothetical protein GGR52DRAFT_497692 [Hypoxylon sp. FL1284]|nr:hypothetical protein GGR52DRAFT_497692 [Hypoxylon sp. FL1284]
MDKREAITASNLGPVVSLLTWIMAATVLIAVGIKFTLSSILPRRRNREDIPLLIATILSIGFTVSLSIAVPNGIGRHQDTLSTQQLESLQKAVYAADILVVLISCCVQISVLLFLHEITPDLLHHWMIYCTAAVIILFTIASFFVAVFPCHPPRVWEILGTQCVDQLSFWQAFAGVNLVVELVLVLLPALIVYPLMMERKRKTIVITGFAARLVAMGAFIAQIIEARALKSERVDRTFQSWKFLITMIFVQGLSIITVCIPYIRNLLVGMESGMIQTGHFRLQSRHGTERSLRLQHITTTNGTPSKMSTNASSNSTTRVEPASSQRTKDGPG